MRTRASTGRDVARAAALVLVLVTVTGCSQRASTLDDLEHALIETHSALASSATALDTLDQGRITVAATETTLEDMTGQAADAVRAVEPVSIGTDADVRDRDAALSVLRAGEQAMITARDQLALHGSADRTPLAAADDQVTGVLEQLRGAR